MAWTRRFLGAAALTLLLAPAAHAETYVVSGTADNTGVCEGTTCTSIRQALASAASNPGADVITIPAGTYQLTQGALAIGSDVTLSGENARTTRIVANAANTARAVEITAAAATLQSLTLQGGRADDLNGFHGGTLKAQSATVTLDRVRVTGGTAASGGGIANRNGTMLITNSLIDHNAATVGDGDGGGILNFGGDAGASANLTLRNTTIAFNTARLAGALISYGNDGDAMTLDHVTIAGNTATDRGVGGMNLPPTGVFSVGSTIVAGNTPTNCGGAQATSAGYNLENGHDCRFDAHDVNAGLETTLSDQGGETDVLRILKDSPARNLGPLDCVTTDQRGGARPKGPRCDAGAFELAYGVAFDSGPSGPTHDARPPFAFSSSETVDGLRCRFDGPDGVPGTLAPCTSPMTAAFPLREGAYSLTVEALRNDEPIDTATRTFSVDQTAPVVSIDEGPQPATNSTSARFVFSANSPATFECTLDADERAPCTSPYVTENLAAGTHRFEVQATDAAGNTSEVVSRSWTVDRTAPPAPVITQPAADGFSTSREITLAGTTETGSTIVVKEGDTIVGGDEDADWQVVVPDRVDGPHVFDVTAVDAAGNVSPAARRTITVDTKEPVTAIDSHPPQRTNHTSVGFTYSANEPSTFTCRLTGPDHETDQELACPAGGITYENLADGDYSFRVRAHDLAGNADDGSENFAFTVKRALPDTPAFTLPADDPHHQTATTVTLRGTGSDGSNVIVEENGQRLGEPIAVGNGLWQRVLENVTPGAHTYDVHAENAAGSTVTVSRTVIVEVAPAIQTPAENALLGTAKFAVTGTASPGTPITLLEGTDVRGTATSDDTGAWSIALSNVPDGTHAYVARTDTGAESAPRTVRVDTTAPETTIESGPGGIINDDTPTFTFGSDDPAATFECIVDEGDFVACPREFTTAPLPEGDHTLIVRAVDAAGNRDQTPVNRVVTVDKTAPAAPAITSPATGLATPETGVVLKGTTEPRTDVRVYDGGVFLDLARIADEGGGTWELPVSALTEGTHVFTARAVDRPGNESPLSTAVSVIVDRTAPAAPTVSGGGLTNDSTPTFTFTSEAGATFACALDTGDAGPCESPLTLPTVADGPHTLTVVATDAAGNPSPAARVDFTVDTTAPAVSITADPGPLTKDATPPFSFTSPDATATFRCAVDQGTPAACTSPTELAALADGPHTFRVVARDPAGNVSEEATRNFTVDTVAPAAAFTSGPNGPTNDATPTFAYTVDSGAVVTCSIDRTPEPDCASPHTLAALADDAHTFRVTATDAAGNTREITRTFTVDTVAPTATITSGPAEGQVLTTDSVHFDFTLSEPEATSLCRLSFNGEPLLQQALCPSFSETDLRNGDYVFEVIPTDAAGNVGLPAQRGFKVAHAGPQAVVTEGPAKTNSRTPTFKFDGPAGSTFRCEVFGRYAPTPCTRMDGYTVPTVPAALPDGEYTFRVVARDANGDAGAPAERRFIIDTRGPALSVASAPTGPTREPTFSFSASEPGTFECRIDGTVTPCGATFAPKVADGQHSLSVVAIDEAGNRSAVIVRSFTVDTTPPAAVDISPSTGGSAASFSFPATDGVTTCRLEGPGRDARFEPCTSPKSYGGLQPGAYRFTLRTTDAAGNTTDSPAREFTVAAAVAATPTPSPAPSATPSPRPEFHNSVVVRPVSGKILVKRPGAPGFTLLDASRGIPLGSIIDAKNGKLQLTVEPGQGKPVQKALFYGGIFLVTQPSTTLDVKLVEELAPCAKKARSAAAKPQSRKLWGDGKGKFRTSGQYSAATVRGTAWFVQDSCEGTLTRVKVGVVSVRDNVRKKDVLLRAGKSYVAKPRR